jgi:ABC-type amino acid transport substrate-binding protein
MISGRIGISFLNLNWAAFGLICCLFPFSVHAGKLGEIRIVTEHYPPYEMETPVNGLHGFDYEVVSTVFKSMG